MRILIDECLNWRLARALTGHEARSVQQMGWAGVKNGKLLALAVGEGFKVFLTADRNLAFQQNLTAFAIAIIVLEAEGIRLSQTLPLMPKVLEILPSAQPGKFCGSTLERRLTRRTLPN